MIIANQHVIFNKERGDSLKISINIDADMKDTEISISCNQLTPKIEKILATLRILDRQLMAVKGEEAYILDVSKIVYIERLELL